MAVRLSCNPQQFANRYAHRPELRDLGHWFYMQRNRINSRWTRAVVRVQQKKRRLSDYNGFAVDDEE